MKVPTPAELRELSTAEQLDLLEAVWDTLAANPESLPLSSEHRRELDRRLEEMERSPEAGVRWSDLRRDLESGS
jgi:putative addiction module component (TIGR02574 family)